MANGRVYTAQFNGIPVTAVQDIFEVNGPSDAVVELMEIHISQSTEVGDTQEENLSILLKTGLTTSGSGGATVTAAPTNSGDAAFGGTVEANNATQASGGTIVTRGAWDWNIRVPFDQIFTPEATQILSPSGRMIVELATAPADSITMSGYLVFKEIGG